jgi:hypothetical protein
MKTIALLLSLPLCLAACVSVELPNVVSDTAKAGKEAYRAATGKGEAKPAPTPSPTPKANEAALISNTYIGKATQTVAEIQQACVAEAAEKLAQTRGSGARPGAYTVIDNQLSIVNNAVVATCRLGAATGASLPA